MVDAAHMVADAAPGTAPDVLEAVMGRSHLRHRKENILHLAHRLNPDLEGFELEGYVRAPIAHLQTVQQSLLAHMIDRRKQYHKEVNDAKDKSPWVEARSRAVLVVSSRCAWFVAMGGYSLHLVRSLLENRMDYNAFSKLVP